MRSHRRGVALYVVIAFLMFAAVLSYELQQLMLQQKAQGSLSSQKLVARSIAHSTLAVVHAAFIDKMNVPGSQLHAVLAGSGAPATGTDLTASLAMGANLTQVTQSVPGATTAVTVKTGPATPLHASFPAASLVAGFGLDPQECRYPINITIDATYGLATVHWELSKEVRYQNLVPGAAAKFTLWADTLTPSDTNSIKTDFVGNILPGNQPLLLHNEGMSPADYSFDRAIYQKRGYVYLGGAPDLHITGGYIGFGELFSFLVPQDLTQNPPPRVPAYEPANLPPFYTQPYPMPGGDQLVYHLLSMVYGFYNGADAKGRALTTFIPSQTNPTCTALHLYGNWVAPTATLVLGNVSRAYCLATGATVEVQHPDGSGGFTGDGVDGVIGLLPDLGHPSTFPVGLPPIVDPCPGLPGSSEAGKMITLQPRPPNPDFPQMFPTPAAYEAVASGVVVEPYDAAYNFMYRADTGSTSFIPTDPVFTGFQDQFRLPAAGPDIFFNGLASGLGALATNPDDPSTGFNAIMRDRSVYRVANREELFELFSSGGELSLGAQVILDNPEDVVDLGDLKIAKDGGGLLVLDSKTKGSPSHFRLTSLTTADDAFGLVLVPQNGDCRLDFTSSDPNTPWPVSVLAPAGTLAVTGGTVELEGTLLAKKLDFNALKMGGDLYYDTRLDPTGTPYAGLYRAYVSDDETGW